MRRYVPGSVASTSTTPAAELLLSLSSESSKFCKNERKWRSKQTKRATVLKTSTALFGILAFETVAYVLGLILDESLDDVIS